MVGKYQDLAANYLRKKELSKAEQRAFFVTTTQEIVNGVLQFKDQVQDLMNAQKMVFKGDYRTIIPVLTSPDHRGLIDFSHMNSHDEVQGFGWYICLQSDKPTVLRVGFDDLLISQLENRYYMFKFKGGSAIDYRSVPVESRRTVKDIREFATSLESSSLLANAAQIQKGNLNIEQAVNLRGQAFEAFLRR